MGAIARQPRNGQPRSRRIETTFRWAPLFTFDPLEMASRALAVEIFEVANQGLLKV